MIFVILSECKRGLPWCGGFTQERWMASKSSQVIVQSQGRQFYVYVVYEQQQYSIAVVVVVLEPFQEYFTARYVISSFLSLL